MAKTDRFSAELTPLWLRAQAGDEAAYADALRVIATRLRNYFTIRLCSLPDEVEDLVQDTLVALHTKRATYDPMLPVSHWVHAIAGYKLVDFWRRRGRRDALHEPIDLINEELLVHETTENIHARHDINILLKILPAQQRTAIILTRIKGLSVSEASRLSGVSVSAIKVQVHRGLKRLAERVSTLT
ncbi:MAG: sigma-70 family RNA polymerase sigma factor [Beijerinckiaceae bacterium]